MKLTARNSVLWLPCIKSGHLSIPVLLWVLIALCSSSFMGSNSNTYDLFSFRLVPFACPRKHLEIPFHSFSSSPFASRTCPLNLRALSIMSYSRLTSLLLIPPRSFKIRIHLTMTPPHYFRKKIRD